MKDIGHSNQDTGDRGKGQGEREGGKKRKKWNDGRLEKRQHVSILSSIQTGPKNSQLNISLL
jgi:hypothetical protein